MKKTYKVKMERTALAYVNIQADSPLEVLKKAGLILLTHAEIFTWKAQEAYAKDVERVDD